MQLQSDAKLRYIDPNFRNFTDTKWISQDLKISSGGGLNMQCPECQFENPEDSNFCIKHGQKLEKKCPQCEKALPVRAKFCNPYAQQDLIERGAQRVSVTLKGRLAGSIPAPAPF